MITGHSTGVSVAHIVPAKDGDVWGHRTVMKTARNGFLLDESLETGYNEHTWVRVRVFDEEGTIKILFEGHDRRFLPIPI